VLDIKAKFDKLKNEWDIKPSFLRLLLVVSGKDNEPKGAFSFHFRRKVCSGY